MTKKLDPEHVRESIRVYWIDTDIAVLQTAIYVACGGGWIGEMHANRPAEAYIDSRVGRLPYSRSEIENMKLVLIAMAEAKGLDPSNLPEMPRFHNCGVF